VSPPPAETTEAGSQPLPTSPTPEAPPPRSRFRFRRPTLSVLIAHLPALVPAAILVAIVAELVVASGLTNFGGSFFGSDWDPTADRWGILVFVVGSFLTALPALFLAMVIGLGIAVSSNAYLPKFVASVLDPFVDLLAGIPSVVYGIWGYLVVAPFLGTSVNPFVYEHFGFVPGFGGHPPLSSGLGLPAAIFVLTLMALPITTLLIRDALASVPRDLWEAGLALGATRWEVTRRVAIPYSTRGILSAGFLGFGRAFGETVAVAMVISVQAAYPVNVYGTTGTMASLMFESLDSAFNNSQWLAALSEIAIVLLAISLVVNLAGRLLVRRIVTYEVAGL
jgi:phosphate transport system permease protein